VDANRSRIESREKRIVPCRSSFYESLWTAGEVEKSFYSPNYWSPSSKSEVRLSSTIFLPNILCTPWVVHCLAVSEQAQALLKMKLFLLVLAGELSCVTFVFLVLEHWSGTTRLELGEFPIALSIGQDIFIETQRGKGCAAPRTGEHCQ
jgi:hypothetical protein